MLIGNKSDLASRRAVTTKEGEQVRKFSPLVLALVLRVSAVYPITKIE